MINIAIYGGSFNPIHNGHVMMVGLLLSYGFSQVIIVPNYSHPYDKKSIDFKHRTNMCRLAMRIYDRTIVSINDIESYMNTPNYSYRTVEEITKNRHCEFRFVLGADLKDDFETWENVDIIKKLAPPLFVGRVGYESSLPAIIPDISSSEIRALIAKGDEETLKWKLPECVRDYIKREGLYND